MSNGEPVIRLSNASLTMPIRLSRWKITKTQILSDINLEIYKSESIAIVGKNGSGKSSLLKLIAGVYKPDQGIVNTFGSNITNLSMNLTTQLELSGWDNIIIKGLIYGMSREQISTKMDDIIEYSGLKEHIYKPVNSYSSGMKTRLDFSVALFGVSDVIMVDEILGVGDEEFRAKSHESIKTMIESNRTVVLVTHNLQLVRQLCTRALLIEKGRILTVGDPSEIVSTYLQSIS